MDSQFVFDAAAGDIVIHQGTIFRAQLGYDKEGNTLCPRRGSLNPGQYHVDNVFGEIMLSAGDKDLSTGNGVGAIIVADRFGAQSAHVCSSLRFGEAHGPAPFTGVHLVHERAFLILSSENLYEPGSSVGEPREHNETPVGCSECLYGCETQGHR